MKIVECVANFSEGRHKPVIEAIVNAIETVPGTSLLDTHSDPDHHRTVVTFAAAPEVIGEAAFQGIRTAGEFINLDKHTGEHPRIGAADVVPLVPLRDTTMQECIAIAHALGQRVAIDLQLPVYFYEYAARLPERRNLAYVRKHPYEKLKQTIATDESRKPDAGPRRLGTAGAVAIGARNPLIAFNVYLNTSDVKIAKSVARAVRESSGGLPCVKALGLLVGGSAQISMNLVDYRKTSLFTVLQKIRTEVEQLGASITHAELVGLIPQAALIDTALAFLQLPLAVHDQTLESRLGATAGDYREIDFQ